MGAEAFRARAIRLLIAGSLTAGDSLLKLRDAPKNVPVSLSNAVSYAVLPKSRCARFGMERHNQCKGSTL